MGEISPVCIQQTDGAVFHCIGSQPFIIFISVPVQVDKLVPAAHARAAVLGRSSLCHPACLFLPLIPQIAPVETDHLLGQFFDHLREVQDHIPPEHGTSSVVHQKLCQFLYIMDVNSGFTQFFHCLPAPALSQVKGLVRADIKLSAGKQLHIFPDHPFQQLCASGIRGIDGMMVHPCPVGEGLLLRILQFAQITVLPAGQQLIQMSEAGKGRHQLNAPLFAVVVQFHDLRSRQRRIVPPQLTEIPEQKGMLNVKLQLVHLIVRHPICQLLKPGKLGHTPSGAVEIISSVGKRRFILDLHARQAAALLADHLQKGLHSVPEPFLLPFQKYTLFVYPKPVAFRSAGIVLADDDISFSSCPSGKSQTVTQLLFQLFRKNPCLPLYQFAAGRPRYQPRVIADLIPFFCLYYFPGYRQ